MPEHHVVFRFKHYHPPVPRDRPYRDAPDAALYPPLMVGLRWVMESTGYSREKILNLVTRDEIPHQIIRGAPMFDPVKIKKWQEEREILP
jgi:hypothetical protein